MLICRFDSDVPRDGNLRCVGGGAAVDFMYHLNIVG